MHVRMVSGGLGHSDPRLPGLLDRAQRAGRPGLSECTQLDLATPASGSVGLEFDDGDGHLVAYARCVASGPVASGPVASGHRTQGSTSAQHTRPAWTMEAVIHPHWEGRIESEVLAVVTVSLLQRGGGSLTWWTADLAHEALATTWGFALERRLEQWRRPLDGIVATAPPASIALRRSTGLQDRDAVLAVRNRACYLEQGEWTEVDLDRRFAATKWFDPEHLWIAEADGVTLGFCWLKWHRADHVAEVDAIVADPETGTPGLGRALASTSLAALGEQQPGATATLYIDGANARAKALCHSLGFVPFGERYAFHVDLPVLPGAVLPAGRPR